MSTTPITPGLTPDQALDAFRAAEGTYNASSDKKTSADSALAAAQQAEADAAASQASAAATLSAAIDSTIQSLTDFKNSLNPAPAPPAPAA